jgi:hypothetical protein
MAKATKGVRQVDDAKGGTRRARGRPPGGRSSDREKYQPLTVYIAREVHADAGARLHREGQGFSDIIEQLLRLWLKKPDLV